MACRTRPRPTSTFTPEGGNSVALSNVAGRKIALLTRPYMANGVTNPIIGKQQMVFNNAGGNATEARGWQAAFFRYCMWSRSVNGVGGTTYHSLYPGLPFYPLLDPARPAIPVIVRFRDVVQITREAGATWGVQSFTAGGGFAFQDGTLEAYRSVGFHNYGGNTWKTYYSGNANVAAQHVVDTGRLISDVCELMCEIDGQLKQVRYYIDGVLVDTFTPPIDNAAVAIHRQEQFYWSNKSDAATTIRHHHGLGIGFLVEVEVL